MPKARDAVDPDMTPWGFVDIQPQTPLTAVARLFHRHHGVACIACEILRLREAVVCGSRLDAEGA